MCVTCQAWILAFLISDRTISLMSRMFTNGPGDRFSILGRVIPNTQKMVLDTAVAERISYFCLARNLI